MKIRKLHRYVAIVVAPFLAFIGISGCLLLFRKTSLYEKETKELLLSFHTWEAVLPYMGLVFGAGLLFLVVTGVIIFFKKNA